MKVNKQQLVEILSREIMKSVARQVREIVREEIDIERKRLRRQLLEELGDTVSSVASPPATSRPASRKPFENVLPKKALLPKPKSYNLTGNPEVDNILNEMKIELDENEAVPANDGFNAPIVAQEEVDVMSFDPTRHDPSQMDWSSIVEAVDERAKEKRQSGLIALPQ